MANDVRKREVCIDAGTGEKAALLKAVEEGVRGDGGRVPVSNYDGLFDVLTEFGAEVRLVVDNAQNLDETAKRVFQDAARSTPGLEIVLNGASPESNGHRIPDDRAALRGETAPSA